MVHYVSVLFIKITFVPIGTERQPLCPRWSFSHHIADFRYVRIYRTFDDKFIVNVTADTIIPQRSHSIAENIPADSLNNILHEFRAIALNALPLLRCTNTLVSDGFASELILADTGLDVGKPPAARQRDEQHSALIFKLNAMCVCAKPLSYCILHAAVDLPPETDDIRVGTAPHIHQRL